MSNLKDHEAEQDAITARYEDRIYRALRLLNAIQDDADIGMETDEIVKQAIKELTK